jgi:hypothetical protein
MEKIMLDPGDLEAGDRCAVREERRNAAGVAHSRP